jgi:hypothetical protein
MGIHRSHLKRRTRNDAAEQKVINAERKDKERDRRRARMLDTLRSGSVPYAPVVMSWLSRELDKPARRITQEDIQQLIG